MSPLLESAFSGVIWDWIAPLGSNLASVYNQGNEVNYDEVLWPYRFPCSRTLTPYISWLGLDKILANSLDSWPAQLGSTQLVLTFSRVELEV